MNSDSGNRALESFRRLPLICLLWCVCVDHFVRPAASGSKKRTRSNDTNTSQLPRARRKCGLCGEEGEFCHIVSINFIRAVMLVSWSCIIMCTLHAATTAVSLLNVMALSNCSYEQNSVEEIAISLML